MAHPRRLTARFRGVPHPAFQTLKEHDRGVINILLSSQFWPMWSKSRRGLDQLPIG